MNLLCPSRNKPSIADDYATSDDFGKLFTEDMTALHLAAYLLTGDQEKAEKCFVTGLEDSVKNDSVFKVWARSWAQRKIVQSAIRMIARRPDRAASAGNSPDHDAKLQSTPARHAAIASVLALGDFERFVLVLSVLERYSHQDCSILLSCSRADRTTARMRARLQISEIQQQHAAPEDDATIPLPAVFSGRFVKLAVKACTFK
jgi:DNA-directed RNA polymerase specialized sigma24 family protein